MRHFRRDKQPAEGWSVDWKIEDRYKYLPELKDIHVRYTDFTKGVALSTAEAWIDTVQFAATAVAAAISPVS